MKDDDYIDGEWHPEAFTAGMEARRMGREINGSDNPYRDYGETHWMLKSFRAGWCDYDQAMISERCKCGHSLNQHEQPRDGEPCTQCRCGGFSSSLSEDSRG